MNIPKEKMLEARNLAIKLDIISKDSTSGDYNSGLYDVGGFDTNDGYYRFIMNTPEPDDYEYYSGGIPFIVYSQKDGKLIVVEKIINYDKNYMEYVDYYTKQVKKIV